MGLTGEAFLRTSKCICGCLALPLMPDVASVWPRWTFCLEDGTQLEQAMVVESWPYMI